MGHENPAPSESTAPVHPIARVHAGPELRRPDEWADATIGTRRSRVAILSVGGVARGPRRTAAHRAAAQLHGWVRHDQHSATPLLLSLEDYAAALESAGRGEVHAPALSPLSRRS
jgi:hypothetical protein